MFYHWCRASNVSQQSPPPTKVPFKETPRNRIISKSVDSAVSPESSPPPSPPIRQLSTQLSAASTPPDIKPRVSSRSSITASPNANAIKQQTPTSTPNKALPCSPVRSITNAHTGKYLILWGFMWTVSIICFVFVYHLQKILTDRIVLML